MKIRIEWESTRKIQGTAYVIEPCCEAVKPRKDTYYRDPYFVFNVWFEDDILKAGFHVSYEDANAIPLRFCPACGASVYVVEEVFLEPRPLGMIQSGASYVKTVEVKGLKRCRACGTLQPWERETCWHCYSNNLEELPYGTPEKE